MISGTLGGELFWVGGLIDLDSRFSFLILVFAFFSLLSFCFFSFFASFFPLFAFFSFFSFLFSFFSFLFSFFSGCLDWCLGDLFDFTTRICLG